MNKIVYYYDRVIGIDLGNGLINVRSEYPNGADYKLNLPSAFVKKEDVGDSMNKRDVQLDYYNINGQVYGWGDEISNLKDIKTSFGHDNRYYTQVFKIMARIVLARVFYELDIQEGEKVLVVTGVPSDETGTEAEQTIKEAFIGETLVEVNGVEVVCNVEEVEVMSQPVATVIGRYLKDSGMVENPSYEDMMVAVIDIGGGTTDFDIIDSLRRLPNYKRSIPKGFHDVYDEMRKVIKAKHSKSDPTDYELLKLVIDYDGEGELLYHPNKRVDPIDVSEAFNTGIYELSMDIESVVSTNWKKLQDKLDEVLLVGGSAELFEGEIADVARGVVVPKNNGESNVEGYFRFGKYLSFEKATQSRKPVRG